MKSRETLHRHADLFDRTSKRLGHDMQAHTMAGDVTIDEIGDAVLRCTNCSNPDDCGHWLERDEAAADAPPVYCRNVDLFQSLDRLNAQRGGKP